MNEDYDDRMCQMCCKLGLTARHKKFLVSSILRKNFSSEASSGSSPRRFRKPAEFPIVRRVLFGSNGRTTREGWAPDDKRRESAVRRAVAEMYFRILGLQILALDEMIRLDSLQCMVSAHLYCTQMMHAYCSVLEAMWILPVYTRCIRLGF